MAMQTYQVNYTNAASSLRLNLYTISTDQNSNTTVERADLWMVVNANHGYWNGYGTPANISVNGHDINQSVTFDARQPAGTTVLLIGSFDTLVYHDGNGNAYIGLSASHQSGVGLGNASLSGAYQCDNIPRYANFTRLDCVNRTINSVTIAWDADASCDGVDYNINGGNPIGGSHPQFTINNLEYNRNYTIRVNIRRSGSGLWTSREIQVQTLDKNRFDGVVNDLIAGEDYNFNFRQNAGAATFFNIYNKDKSILIASRANIHENTNIGGVYNHNFEFEDNELDNLFKLFGMSNEIEVVVQIETEWYGAHYYDEHIKKCVLKGNVKTVKIKQDNLIKRAKVFVKQNDKLQKAVTWVKQDNIVKRCI